MGRFDFSPCALTGVDAHLVLQYSVALVLTCSEWGMGMFNFLTLKNVIVLFNKNTDPNRKKMSIYEGQKYIAFVKVNKNLRCVNLLTSTCVRITWSVYLSVHS